MISLTDFAVADLYALELALVVEPMSPREFRQGRMMIRKLWRKNGGKGVTGRDRAGDVVFIALLIRLEERRGLFVLYTTNAMKKAKFAVLRLFRRNIDAFMASAGIRSAIAPAFERFHPFMRFLGFERTENVVSGIMGPARVYVKNA